MAERSKQNLGRAAVNPVQGGFGILVLLFSRQWILPSFLILLGMAGLIQLGFWQLDRLEWRRGENRRLQAQWEAPPISMNELGTWDENALHDRRAYAVGTFDYSHQVGIKNRFYKSDPGIHLFTAFRLQGSDRILMVDRGWIPIAAVTNDWSSFHEETGAVEIRGLLQRSQSLSLEEAGGRQVDIPRDNLWYREDLTALQEHWDMELEPMFLLQETSAPHAGKLPRKSGQIQELTEGNHLSYAIQWYSFAAILGIGYVLLVRKRTSTR